MIKNAWFVYILGIHALLIVILAKSDFVEKVAAFAGFYHKPEMSAYYKSMTECHKRKDSSVPTGATIFIGDSITQGLDTSLVSELSVNYGIGSDTTVGVINRLPIYDSINTAKAIVIAIGVNDLRRRENNHILENYNTILNSLPKDKKIVMSAVLPVDERVCSATPSNKRIMELNSALEKMSSTYENIVYIDARKLLQEANGNLKSNFHNGDGVHLSAAGYKAWAGELRKALKDK